MALKYDGKAVIPMPLLGIRRENKKNRDGLFYGSEYSLTLTSKQVAYKGSPSASGELYTGEGYPPDDLDVQGDTDKRLGALFHKVKGIQDIFKENYKLFELEAWDGVNKLTCYPIVESFDFPQDRWVDYFDYTVNLSCPVLYLNGVPMGSGGQLTNLSDTWSVEPDERGRVHAVTHTVSAEAYAQVSDAGVIEKNAWEVARDGVMSLIGLGIVPSLASGSGVVFGGAALNFYDYSRSITSDKQGGTYSVTEKWKGFDPGEDAVAAVEEYSMDMREDENEKISITVNGTIQGLEERDNTTGALVTDRWTNAKAKWEIVKDFLKGRAASGYAVDDLREEPGSNSRGINPLNGTISYSRGFTNAQSGDIPGTLDSDIEVVDEHPAEVFASIAIPLRAAGPILQDIGTITSRRRTVNISATLPAATGGHPPAPAPNTDAIVLSYRPVASVIFLEGDRESYTASSSRKERSYSRSTSWVWQV